MAAEARGSAATKVYLKTGDFNPVSQEVVHGGTASILGIVWQLPAERRLPKNLSVYTPGLPAAIVIHSLLNHLFFSPAFSTLVIQLAFPPLIFAVFSKSETALRATQRKKLIIFWYFFPKSG